MAPTEPDGRSPGTLVRQWKDIQSVKTQLIKEGVLDGNATVAEVVAALRNLIPADYSSRAK